MIDSLLTLTDEHLRDHKYLTLSAFLDALKALSSHLQVLTFLFYFHQPKLNDKFLFVYIICKNAQGEPSCHRSDPETNKSELLHGTSGLILANSCVHCL